MNHHFLRRGLGSARIGPALFWLLALPLLLHGCATEQDAEHATERPDLAPAEVAVNAAVRLLAPPAAVGAMAPNWSHGGVDGRDEVSLTWLVPTSDGHALSVATLVGETWSAPGVIASGGDFFANWADLPQATTHADGTWFAHWLAKLGDDTYAYGASLARSRDAGATWQSIGLLHDDASATEHGFVSYAQQGDGAVQAFWLDGRAMPSGGGMQLRTTRLGKDGPEPSTKLDDRVCECCATDAATTSAGPVVVYRDRSDSEVRDMAIVRMTKDGWSAPARIHDDGWQIQGCPVNGPAIAAAGDHVAVAWFTAADEQARVRVAMSHDGGATFGPPVLVDGDEPLGRVDVVIGPDGAALISWLGTVSDERMLDQAMEHDAEIRWRSVAVDGTAGPARTVAATMRTRSAGVPRMIRRDDALLFAWVDDRASTSLRVATVPIHNGAPKSDEVTQ